MGNDPKSDGLLFYSPDFKSLIGSADYILDPVPPSGPVCNIPYDGGSNSIYTMIEITFIDHQPINRTTPSNAYKLTNTVLLKTLS